ncbi:hypothetical protein ABT039_18035 [Streptomyces lasiicapitis]|uniref:hypothetical protein n=1 Tax=Streptomyces lasiicapitis TaxID=1923961 RepID=UPI003328D112
MEIEVIRDEYGSEYTERVPGYPEPDAEPQCWTHHSNSCGGQTKEQALDPVEHWFSTEPPLPPDLRCSSREPDLWPRW